MEVRPGPSWTEMRTFARAAEDAGFASLWVTDHVLDDGQWNEPAGHATTGGAGKALGGCWEAWTLLAALAEATHRIELGPLVTCTAYRNPALLVEMAETVDEISAGRVVLGLGAGDHWGEHRAFGYVWKRRVDRFEEALNIIVPLLREGHVDFIGKHYEAHIRERRPRGPRPLGPPIMIGALASGPRMLDLSARFADLWNGFLVWNRDPLGTLPALCARVDETCAAVGRDPKSLLRTVAVGMALGSRPNGLAIYGDEDGLAETIVKIATFGISHIQVHLEPRTPKEVERFGRVLERLSV